MSKRQEYVARMEDAFEKLQVKASLAKLELREVRRDLVEEYDELNDRLDRLAEAADDQWDSLREGLESGWAAFQKRYREALAKHREE